jgi:hypothetical protein
MFISGSFILVCSYANVAVFKILPLPGPIGLVYFFLQEGKAEGRNLKVGWVGKGKGVEGLDDSGAIV